MADGREAEGRSTELQTELLRRRPKSHAFAVLKKAGPTCEPCAGFYASAGPDPTSNAADWTPPKIAAANQSRGSHPWTRPTPLPLTKFHPGRTLILEASGLVARIMRAHEYTCAPCTRGDWPATATAMSLVLGASHASPSANSAAPAA